jgi:hypothetical protein
VLISAHDRGTICIVHKFGSKMIMGAPDGTPR